MSDEFGKLFAGVVIIALGISNLRGNISTLHSYHRKRVKEEDKLPFGRMVGTGTVIAGATVLLCGALDYAAKAFALSVLAAVSKVLIAVGLAVGLGICIYAIIKYNKGLF